MSHISEKTSSTVCFTFDTVETSFEAVHKHMCDTRTIGEGHALVATWDRIHQDWRETTRKSVENVELLMNLLQRFEDFLVPLTKNAAHTIENKLVFLDSYIKDAEAQKETAIRLSDQLKDLRRRVGDFDAEVDEHLHPTGNWFQETWKWIIQRIAGQMDKLLSALAILLLKKIQSDCGGPSIMQLHLGIKVNISVDFDPDTEKSSVPNQPIHDQCVSIQGDLEIFISIWSAVGRRLNEIHNEVAKHGRTCIEKNKWSNFQFHTREVVLPLFDPMREELNDHPSYFEVCKEG